MCLACSFTDKRAGKVTGIMDGRKLYIGRVYRHFKGKLYRALGVAINSETDEKMVLYQALYGKQELYVRPYDMFLEELDTAQYPDAKQKYRFELVEN